MLFIKGQSLCLKFDNELMTIKPWGKNSLRVSSSIFNKDIPDNALEKSNSSKAKITINNNRGEIINGDIKAVIDHRNKVSFYKKDQLILQEFIRLRAVKHDDGSEDAGTIERTNDFNSTLKLKSREFKANFSSDYKITVRFESDPNEKIFGMGQYQHDFLDLKNTVLELAHRNSQITIPFYLSSLGYGFMWNNPAIGEVIFAKNITEWRSHSSYYIDYWITVDNSPDEIIQNFTSVVGRVPMISENLLGLWQSKLRYRTQDEILKIVNHYKEKNIQLSTIAIDYFHWTKQGEYRFDKNYWPNPEQLVKTLKNLNIKPIVSVWPTVQSNSENYQEYLENGLLVHCKRGLPITMQIQGNTTFADMTNPNTRHYIWNKLKQNYINYGFDNFWLDVAEPGYSVYDFDNYDYYKGSNLQCGNTFPNDFLKMVYYGSKEQGIKNIITLVRGGWLGAQKYGALIWSGDIDSSFKALRNQINTGLNMGIAGIPWWTTDIGGFHGGNPNDEKFRELIVRWFQYATFSPILRMHGDRQPHQKPLSQSGGGAMVSGADNEIWSYGDFAEKIMTKYIHIRQALKPYLIKLMKEAHQFGRPLMRPLFYHYPNDTRAWLEKDNYLFGEDLYISPILYSSQQINHIYLPQNSQWLLLNNNQLYKGGKDYIIQTPKEDILVFIKQDKISQFPNFKTLQSLLIGENNRSI